MRTGLIVAMAALVVASPALAEPQAEPAAKVAEPKPPAKPECDAPASDHAINTKGAGANDRMAINTKGTGCTNGKMANNKHPDLMK